MQWQNNGDNIMQRPRLLTKTCTKCGREKPITDFHKDRTKNDGLYSSCKICNVEYMKIYREQHLEQERNRCRKYYKSLRGYLKNVFHCMKQRCQNPKTHNYHRYGGRGIEINFKSEAEFIDYITNELQVDPRGLLIDRINNNGNYEKGNIRFVTAKQSVKNRRYNEK